MAASDAVAGGLIHDDRFLAVVFVLLAVGMLVLGRLRPRAGGAFVHADAEMIDLEPWRLAVPVGVALLLAVFSIQAFFADFSVLTG